MKIQSYRHDCQPCWLGQNFLFFLKQASILRQTLDTTSKTACVLLKLGLQGELPDTH